MSSSDEDRPSWLKRCCLCLFPCFKSPQQKYHFIPRQRVGNEKGVGDEASAPLIEGSSDSEPVFNHSTFDARPVVNDTIQSRLLIRGQKKKKRRKLSDKSRGTSLYVSRRIVQHHSSMADDDVR